MIPFLLLLQSMSWAAKPDTEIRLNAKGQVLSEIPRLKPGKPLKFVLQFSTPKEFEDAFYTLSYLCIDSNGKAYDYQERDFDLPKKFKPSVPLTVDPECQKKADRIEWNLTHGSQQLRKPQKLLHRFLESSLAIERLIHEQVLELAEKDPEAKVKINQQIIDEIAKNEKLFSTLSKFPEEYKMDIKNYLFVDLDIQLDGLKPDSGVEQMLVVQQQNRRRFAPYWDKNRKTVDGIVNRIAKLKNQLRKETNPEKRADTSADLKVAKQDLENMAIKAWPVNWLSSGFVEREKMSHQIDVRRPSLVSKKVGERERISILLYNTKSTWELSSVERRKLVEEHPVIQNFDADLMTLLPGSGTMRLALNTINAVIANSTTSRTLLTDETVSTDESSSWSPPPPPIFFQSVRPAYGFQYVPVGSFRGGTEVSVRLSSEDQTLDQKISVYKKRRIGIRLGISYAVSPPRIESLVEDDVGEVVLEGGVPMLNYTEQPNQLGLLYGIGIYMSPTLLDNAVSRQPMHLFIGSSYNGGTFRDALFPEDGIIDGYFGLGFDIANGVGFLGGVKFGSQTALTYSENKYNWNLRETYGYNGFFAGISGDLRLGSLFTIFDRKE